MEGVPPYTTTRLGLYDTIRNAVTPVEAACRVGRHSPPRGRGGARSAPRVLKHKSGPVGKPATILHRVEAGVRSYTLYTVLRSGPFSQG